MGALRLPETSDFTLNNKSLKDYPKDFPKSFPALLIGKLVTDKSEEGKNAASLLVQYATFVALQTREEIGCTYLLAHAYAKDSVVKWYKKKGFRTHIGDYSKKETIPMYLELID